MKASVKSDYACRAVEALALHHPNARPLRIEEIAEREAIPANYLVQILIELKSKGLIQSRRGKAGGYALAKTPREITVGDVLRAVQGDVLEMPLLLEEDLMVFPCWNHEAPEFQAIARKVGLIK